MKTAAAAAAVTLAVAAGAFGLITASPHHPAPMALAEPVTGEAPVLMEEIVVIGQRPVVMDEIVVVAQREGERA